MSKQDKDVDAHKPKRETPEAGDAKRDVSRPKGESRAWGTVAKFPGGGKKFDARRYVPSGPLGGSGRKTSVSRSS